MKPCTFVRKNCEGWEFGHMQIDDKGAGKHVVVGKAPTYEEALTQNNMAAKGSARRGFHDSSVKPAWVDYK